MSLNGAGLKSVYFDSIRPIGIKWKPILVNVIFILMQAAANSRSEFNVNQREQLGTIRLI